MVDLKFISVATVSKVCLLDLPVGGVVSLLVSGVVLHLVDLQGRAIVITIDVHIATVVVDFHALVRAIQHISGGEYQRDPQVTVVELCQQQDLDQEEEAGDENLRCERPVLPGDQVLGVYCNHQSCMGAQEGRALAGFSI